MDVANPDQFNGVRRGSIVEVAPPPTEPRAADRAIAAVARDNFGTYRPSEHLIEVRRTVCVPHDDYDGYVEAHVRRLEALRRAGLVEAGAQAGLVQAPVPILRGLGEEQQEDVAPGEDTADLMPPVHSRRNVDGQIQSSRCILQFTNRLS